MTGTIHFQKKIYRKDLKDHPEVLYVFGDNMARRGYGGQAREMRGEPNAVGIPTKWLPSTAENAYFTDRLGFTKIIETIDQDFERLEAHLKVGGEIVWPSYGIGTGLANLGKRAPLIAAYIDKWKRCLMDGTKL